MRTIGVVTVGRSDYGIYRPLLKKIQEDPDLDLYLIAAGMHLSPEFGLTIKSIEADGFEIDERVEMLLSSDTPGAIAKSMGLGAIGFSQAFERSRPDILVVLGDRFEMHAAALAALPFKIPVAHIHGGEITQGAIDDALRHSMTKLSHLHFVSTKEYAKRVVQLGEEEWRVVISGALSLDNFLTMNLLGLEELETRHNIKLEQPFLLVTFHPVTLEYEQTSWHISELLSALHQCGLPVLFTIPNADTSSRIITARIEEFVATHSLAQIVHNLGTQSYFSAMALAAAMVGNSSSGIIEALSFKLPVVNIGSRQHGRHKAANVIDAGYSRTEIAESIRIATSLEFRAKLSGVVNSYGSGQASEKIIKRLKQVVLDDRLITKRFNDVGLTAPVGVNIET